MTLQPGATLGPYRILEQTGRGGMATVYKAHQPALARYVAIKVLPPYLAEDEGFRERFRSEAVAIAKLRHPNILQVFDSGEEAGLSYIVTEFVEGGTLAEQLGSPLPLDYALRILRPVASALDYAHARHVVHRDVKPSNVLLAPDGTPVLADFGLARMIGSLPRLTQTGSLAGTPEYMAPEQAEGESAGPAADRYALAVIAYEMLTGSVPYSADTPLATLLAHAHQPLPLPRAKNPALSAEIEAVLLKGLAKRPADRYPSALAFVDALAAAAAAQASAVAAPLSVAAPAAPAARASAALALPRFGRPRRPQLLAAAGVAALLVIGGALAFPRTATPSPAVAAPASSDELAKVRGALLLEAALDGTDRAFSSHNIVGDPSAAAWSFKPGEIDCTVLKPGGNASAALAGVSATGGLERYVVEAALSYSSDATAISTSLWLPQYGAGLEALKIYGNGDTTRLEANRDPLPAGGASDPFSASAPVAGLRSGRPVVFDVVVDPPRFALYVDGAKKLEGTHATAGPRPSGLVGITCASGAQSGATGTVRIAGLRVYRLATAAPLAASPSATASPAPLRKGVLLWSGALDLASGDFDKPYTIGDPTASSLRTASGALELAVLKASGNTGVTMTRDLPLSFVGEIEFSVKPGSDLAFGWIVHPSPEQKRNYQLEVDAAGESLRLYRYNYDTAVPVAQRTEFLGAQARIPGLQTGRAIRLAVAAEATRYRVYVDGTLALDIGGLAPAQQATPFSFAAFGRGGMVTLSAVRAYAQLVSHAAPARGALVFEAALDGTTAQIQGGQRRTTGNPADSEARFLPGVIELTVPKKTSANVGTSVPFNMPTRRTYVAEYDLAFAVGTNLSSWAIVRNLPQNTGYSFTVYPQGKENLVLTHFDNPRGRHENLTPQVAVDGLASGRTVTIAIVVEATRMTLYVDEKQVAQAANLTAPTQADALSIGVSATNASGTLRILGVRTYELP